MLSFHETHPSTSVSPSMARGKNVSRVAPLLAPEDADQPSQSTPRPSADSTVPKSSPEHDLSKVIEQERSFCNDGFTVGYALTKKKTKSFIQPKLIDEVKKKGICLVAIESSRSLSEQGPFHVILHKISGKEWRRQLEDYRIKFPHTIIVDHPESIQQLRNRQSMLQAVADADLRHCSGRVRAPRQLVVTGDPSGTPSLVDAEGLRLPLVVKPLVADGTVRSHTMYLAYNEKCLSALDPPFVLQEFVNHGGVLFKVYVVGNIVRVVKRLSLPDLPLDAIVGNSDSEGLDSFSRVSSAAAAAKLSEPEKLSDLPPKELLESLASQLRQKLDLQLFNIDLIKEGGTEDGYFVIDINYFPGYGKVPGYEIAFAEFLSSLAQTRRKKALDPHSEAPA